MKQKRIFRTLEYSARLVSLTVENRRAIATDLTGRVGAVVERKWSAGPNLIYIIGDWLDASRPRGRAWWLTTLLVYLIGGAAVMAGHLPLAAYAQGALLLVSVFGVALAIGAAYQIWLEAQQRITPA